MRATCVLATAVLAMLLAGCGWLGDAGTLVGRPPGPDVPPPVVVRHAAGTVELAPWSYCFGAVCADGIPPDPLPDVGAADELEVVFPLDGWTFTATLDAEGADPVSTELAAGPGGTHLLRPVGPAGDHEVTLFGRGGDGGDLVVSLRWTHPGAR